MKKNNPTLFVDGVNVFDNTNQEIKTFRSEKNSKVKHRIDDLKAIYYYNNDSMFTFFTKDSSLEGKILEITNTQIILECNGKIERISFDSFVDFKIMTK